MAGAAVKAKISHRTAEYATRPVSQIVATESAQGPPNQHPRKAVSAKKIVVGKNPGEQQREVALDQCQSKYGVQAIKLDQLRQKLKTRHGQIAVSSSSEQPYNYVQLIGELALANGSLAIASIHCLLLTTLLLIGRG